MHGSEAAGVIHGRRLHGTESALHCIALGSIDRAASHAAGIGWVHLVASRTHGSH